MHSVQCTLEKQCTANHVIKVYNIETITPAETWPITGWMHTEHFIIINHYNSSFIIVVFIIVVIIIIDIINVIIIITDLHTG